MFDISSADSFAKAREWVKELQRQGNPGMIMSLAGNKADLAETREVRLGDFQGSFRCHTFAYLGSDQRQWSKAQHICVVRHMSG